MNNRFIREYRDGNHVMMDNENEELVMKFSAAIPLEDIDEVIAIVNKNNIEGRDYVKDIKEVEINVACYLWFKHNIGLSPKEKHNE